MYNNIVNNPVVDFPNSKWKYCSLTLIATHHKMKKMKTTTSMRFVSTTAMHKMPNKCQDFCIP